MSPAELKRIYTEREAAIEKLIAKGTIVASDLQGLDRIGRCTVAIDHWGICDESARQALRDDVHHFVRSCAALAG